ncbi:hypothetical protein H1R20_g9671, partial [Candolleomyces eurysporus]
MDLQRFEPLRHFIVWDAGVGMVNLAVYQIIGHIAHPDSAEICAWSGANCGSFFLGLGFRELAKRVIDQTLLMHHPVRLDPAPFADFMQYFSECDKPDYSGVKDDAVDIEQFASKGSPRPGRRPGGCSGKNSSIKTSLQVLLLVGGFAGSEHLGQRVKQQFSKGTRFIARPPDSDTAKLWGAAQYRLAKRGFGFDSYLSEAVS